MFVQSFLTFLAAQKAGIFVFLVSLITLALLVQWLLWMFGLGRFRRDARERSGTSSQQPLRYVLTDLFVQIINDFRHLLALVVMVVFAATLFFAMWPGLQAGSIEQVKDGLQAVAAALGGLIGSIIGYYFGEAAATKKASLDAQEASGKPAVQASGEIQPTPTPEAVQQALGREPGEQAE